MNNIARSPQMPQYPLYCAIEQRTRLVTKR
jgi:hypothetical protein